MNSSEPLAKPSASFYWWVLLGFGAISIIYALPWRFQVNDDVIMMWLISGAYTGEPENYAVFVHPLLSYLLSSLYQLIPTFSWYGGYQYFLIFISFAAGSRVVDHVLISTQSKILYQILLLLVTLHLCIFPQFTLVAGWSAFAALLLLMYLPRDKKIIALALLLLLCSGLLRAEASLLVFLGVTWFWLYRFQKSKAFNLSLALILLLTLFVSKTLWENQSEYQAYLAFNKARHQVIDHPVFFQKTLKKEYSGDPKWKAFSHWLIQESPVSIADLNGKYAELNAQYFTVDHIGESLDRLKQVHMTELFKSFLALAFLVLIWVHFRKDKKMLFFVGAWILFLLVFNHFNHIRGRVIFLFYLPLLYLVLVKNLSFKTRRIFGITLSILGLFFSIHLMNFLKEAQKRKNHLSQYENLLSKLDPRTPLYLEGYPLEYFSHQFNSQKETPFFVEGWIARSPFQKKAFERLGFHHLSELKSYYLIAVKEKEPFDFPDYMNSMGEDFTLVKTQETSDLVLFEFRKN